MRRMNTGVDNWIERLVVSIALAAIVTLAPGNAKARHFKVLHAFCLSDPNCPDGASPTAPLLADTAGNLYGTTSGGGNDLSGTVFKLKSTARGRVKFKSLVSFSGAGPNNGPPIVDTAGNLYGEYVGGGFYKVSYGFGKRHNQWGYVNLPVSCSQTNCGTLVGGLTYAGQSSGIPYDGTSPLYGAASSGGMNNAGAIFSLTPEGGQWTLKALYNFCSLGGQTCADGSQPAGGVILDGSGNLLGLTSEGGNGFQNVGAGVAYELSSSGSSWAETVLYVFCSARHCRDGAAPEGNLVMDAAGNLFGTTRSGGKCRQGQFGCGTIFRLVPNGTHSLETVLYRFCAMRGCHDGGAPEAGLVLGSAGDFFGTTAVGGKGGGGTLYELSGSSFQVLHSFCSAAGCTDGEEPVAVPIFGPGGALYGTTLAGGDGRPEDGVVFEYHP